IGGRPQGPPATPPLAASATDASSLADTMPITLPRSSTSGRCSSCHLPGCMVAVCKDHADLKIARVIPRAGQRRDFPRGGRAPAPWEKIPATTGRENQPSPPCRPDAPCGSRQSATEKIFHLLSTKPDHWPHPLEQLWRQSFPR